MIRCRLARIHPWGWRWAGGHRDLSPGNEFHLELVVIDEQKNLYLNELSRMVVAAHAVGPAISILGLGDVDATIHRICLRKLTHADARKSGKPLPRYLRQFEVAATEALMLVAAIFVEIPVMMIFLSRVLKYRANRLANIIAGVITILFVVGGGSLTLHYLFIAAVEVICMLLIIWYAWRWQPAE